MTKEEMLKLITTRFDKVEKRVEAVEKMLGNMTLTVLSLNEMLDPLIYEKATRQAMEEVEGGEGGEEAADLSVEEAAKKVYELAATITEAVKKDAIQKAGEQLGRFAAQAKIGLSDPNSLFRKYGKLGSML